MAKKKLNQAPPQKLVEPSPPKPWYKTASVVISIVAVLLAAISLLVSFGNYREGAIANRIRVVPSLTLSLRSGLNTPEYDIFVSNDGLGPAIIIWARAYLNGRLYHSWREFVTDGHVQSDRSVVTTVRAGRTITLASGGRRSFITVTYPNGKLADSLNAKARIDLCYCSYYGECSVLETGFGVKSGGREHRNNNCILDVDKPSTK